MSTLDLVVLPGIVRALENAARATAAGHHEAALDDARRALELLGREVVRVTHGGSVGVGVTRVSPTQEVPRFGSVKLAREAYLAEHPGERTAFDDAAGWPTFVALPGPPAKDPLVAAKERLGCWLAAEPGRTWDYGTGSVHFVSLYEVGALFDPEHRFDLDDHEPIDGEGETMADAIMAALDAANGGDRG